MELSSVNKMSDNSVYIHLWIKVCNYLWLYYTSVWLTIMKVAFNWDFYLYVLRLQFHCVISFKMIIMIIFFCYFYFQPCKPV